MASTYNNLGALHSTSAGQPAAWKSFEQARIIWEKLVAAYPKVTQYQLGLGGIYGNLGRQTVAGGQSEDGLAWYAKAISVLQAVRQREPNHPTARIYLRNTHRGRAEVLTQLGRHAEALQEWDRTLELETGPERSKLRLQHAYALAHLGEHARATAETDELANAPKVTGGSLYDAAGVYAAASANVEQDATLSAAKQQALAEQYAARALALLTQAERVGNFKGPAKIDHLQKNAVFTRLRSRPDFPKPQAEPREK